MIRRYAVYLLDATKKSGLDRLGTLCHLTGMPTPRVRLVRALKKSGKSRAQVAGECGVTDGAVKHWLRGVRIPRPKYWAAIARALNISVGQVAAEFTGQAV